MHQLSSIFGHGLNSCFFSSSAMQRWKGMCTLMNKDMRTMWPVHCFSQKHKIPNLPRPKTGQSSVACTVPKCVQWVQTISSSFKQDHTSALHVSAGKYDIQILLWISMFNIKFEHFFRSEWWLVLNKFVMYKNIIAQTSNKSSFIIYHQVFSEELKIVKGEI